MSMACEFLGNWGTEVKVGGMGTVHASLLPNKVSTYTKLLKNRIWIKISFIPMRLIN
jgi:hypothetical protein